MTDSDTIRQAATLAHKAAAREIATALAKAGLENTPEAWLDLIPKLREHLDAREAAMLAYAALRAMEQEDVFTVLREVVAEEDAGPPPIPFSDVILDAAWWAGLASMREVRAYAMAALRRLPRDKRRAMVRALEKVGG